MTGEASGVLIDPGICFFLKGEEDASAGEYTPLVYRIRPRGDDLAEHHVMHLHEIHHKVLNDDTAWGSLIHVAARHTDWGHEFLHDLVDSCRTVHETFASYMSLSLARARHEHVEEVLDRYPIYVPLARRMEALLLPVAGIHRKELAATGIVRWCMSPPIIGAALDVYPRALTLAEIPAALRPDHRFRLLLTWAGAAVGPAAEIADRVFEATRGERVDTVELDELDSTLDEAWGLWENAFVEALVTSVPRLACLPTIAPDTHLNEATALVREARERGVAIDLPQEPDGPTLSDVESVQRLLRAMTLPIRDAPYPGALATAGVEVDLEGVLALCEAGSRPHLVVHARRARDLARTFIFSEGDRARLTGPTRGPVFAIRNLLDDGDDGELLLNTVIDGPPSLVEVASMWRERGVAAVCVTASCFLEPSWQDEWNPTLRAWPVVVFLDMGLGTMLGEGRLLGSDAKVYGTYVGLGRRDITALAWYVDGHPHVMLAMGDDLTIQLIAGQLRDLCGDRLSMEDSDWSPWLDALSAVASNVLATEPALRFDGGTLEDDA